MRIPAEADKGEREISGVRLKTVRVGVRNLFACLNLAYRPLRFYQLRVVFCGVSPLVWLRLLVASDTSLAELGMTCLFVRYCTLRSQLLNEEPSRKRNF
jgi:hypothetical protein